MTRSNCNRLMTEIWQLAGSNVGHESNVSVNRKMFNVAKIA